MKKELTILLPSYKEEENLKNILPCINEMLSGKNIEYELLVIDTMLPMDNTQAVCVDNGAVYYNRTGNNYYGDAVRCGIKEAQGQLIVIMDADGSHPVDKVMEMLEQIKEGTDLVIGSRYVDGGDTQNGKVSKLMSKSVNWAFRKALKIDVCDISNSFRMYKSDMIKSIDLQCNNFDIVEEIIVKLSLKYPDLKIKEIPITFLKRDSGKSKRKLIPFIFSYFKTLNRLKKMRKQIIKQGKDKTKIY